MTVHTRLSKLKIAQIESDTEYSRVKEDGDWLIVRFFDPIIPVWVSADFMTIGEDVAVVAADRLNMRLSPRENAPILASVARGYRSEILATENNFVQIKAPTWLPFALSRNSAQDKSGSSVIAESPNTELPIARAPAVNVSTEPNSTESNKATSMDSGWKTSPATNTKTETEKLPLVSNDTTKSEIVEEEAPDSPAVESQVTELSESHQSAENDYPVTRAASPSELQHRLAPGDTISLIVFGEPDLSASNLRIPQSGSVSFPLIGSVAVAGQTIKEVERVVREMLSGGFVRNPRLTVSIESYRPIFILGEVQQIGSFPYSEGLTVAKALATAGGAKNSALANGVNISRDGQEIVSGLPVNSEFQILSGDIISVAKEEGVAGEAAFYVYLHGEVARPGEYEFRRGLTVEKAVVLAGGFTLRASRRRIAITRITEESETPVKLKKVALHMSVEPGDIIDVGASWF